MAKGIYVGVETKPVLTNCDFTNGLEGWTLASGSTLRETYIEQENGVNIFKFKTSEMSAYRTILKQNFEFDTSHIYYAHVYLKSEGNTASSSATTAYYDIYVGGTYITSSYKPTTEWEKFSYRGNMNDGGFSIQGQDKGAYYMYIKDISLYDLTAIFGAGNEPTQEWCEANLGNNAYFGTKARKTAKAYVGVSEAEKFVDFTSNPAPTGWTSSSDYLSATASNDYGKWNVEATPTTIYSASRVSYAFDGDNNGTVYGPDDMPSNSAVYLTLIPPTEISIKPTSIYVKQSMCNYTTKPCYVQAFDGEQWDNLGTLTASTEQTFSISTDKYYSKFRLELHAEDGEDALSIYSFRLMSGTIKISEKLNISRKIKKGYIGVGGVARPFYSAEQRLAYYGEVDTAASEAYSGSNAGVTTVGDYAIFAGGGYSTTYSNQVNAYNSSLIKSTPSTLSTGRIAPAAATVGNYAIIAGGMTSSSTYTNTVDVYTNTLSKATANGLSNTNAHLAATTVGNYALFGGGYYYSSKTSYYLSTVDTYTSSLAKSTTTALSVARYHLAATTVGDYAMFAGGQNASGLISTVDTYTSSLAKSTTTALSGARHKLAATTVGDYALFAGGYVGGDEYASAIVDTYNSSLVKGTATTLSHGRFSIAATTLGGIYAMFAGGTYKSGTAITYSMKVDTYTSNLVKGVATDVPIGLSESKGTCVGNYALFGIVRRTIYGYQLVD